MLGVRRNLRVTTPPQPFNRSQKSTTTTNRWKCASCPTRLKLFLVNSVVKRFPRRKTVIPFDIVLSHEEKWMYPDANNPGEKLPYSKHTTKFYCVDSKCVKVRFPYFEPKLYLETKSVEQRLKEYHRTLLRKELGYWEKVWCMSIILVK